MTPLTAKEAFIASMMYASLMLRFDHHPLVKPQKNPSVELPKAVIYMYAQGFKED